MTYLTSDNVWELKDLPNRLVVLGGGPIGCELTQTFCRLGSTVTQVEMMPQIMGREDAEVAELIQEKLESEGVRVLTNHRAKAVKNENGEKTLRVDYSAIPWGTYTDPEVARVGLNETDAKEKEIAFELTRYDISDLDRAIADSEDHGFIKVLTKPGTDKILGVTIVGTHASELLAEYVFAVKHGLGLNKILGTIHTYPTMSEANKYAAGVWKKAHAPEKILNWLGNYHTWRRG